MSFQEQQLCFTHDPPPPGTTRPPRVSSPAQKVPSSGCFRHDTTPTAQILALLCRGEDASAVLHQNLDRTQAKLKPGGESCGVCVCVVCVGGRRQRRTPEQAHKPARAHRGRARAGSDVTHTDLVECFLRDPAEVHAVVAGGSHFHLWSRAPPLRGKTPPHVSVTQAATAEPSETTEGTRPGVQVMDPVCKSLQAPTVGQHVRVAV